MLKISYAGCLGLSPVISAKIHSKCASQTKIAKNSLKPPILGFKGVQGYRCWYPCKAICNRSRARLLDSSRNRAFWRRYPNLMPSYGGLVEPTGSNVTPLKSTFNAEHFICRLSWSISNVFGAIYS